MIKLPVIVGIGGMNAAGRSSGFHGYKRMVCDVLSHTTLQHTWRDLAHRMGVGNPDRLTDQDIERIKQGTLVRRIEQFDPQQVLCHHKATLSSTTSSASFVMKKNKLSDALLATCDVEALDNQDVRVTPRTECDILIPDTMVLPVSSAGGLPSGFDLDGLYHSHHHPRGLKLAVYGASDALNSLGMEWDFILSHIRPDQVSVYGGSALSQIDEYSLAGIIGQPLRGNRINSKMMALSLCEMPADFVNSYVINSVGATGNNVGACATFLYNLRQAVTDIQHGKAKVAIVGNTEAPIVPEVIEGFRVMGALATDESLCGLDDTEVPDHRRACRPFSTNSGFTLAEAGQFVVLMEDELALRLGANIYGSVADIFVNADANKKSIAGPGVGNYITVAKAAALAKSILGDAGLRRTYVQAHGTGTPQNRVTESHILNETARLFSIDHWVVSAIKSYIGHTISAAGADQLISALGAWQYGWIPGIKTIDHIAEDVYQSNLDILMDHHPIEDESGHLMEGVIINSKGFGGNNASGLVLSPQKTLAMLKNKYGSEMMKVHQAKNQSVYAASQERDLATCGGQERMIYKFGESVMDHTSVSMTQSRLELSEFSQCIELPQGNPYEGY